MADKFVRIVNRATRQNQVYKLYGSVFLQLRYRQKAASCSRPERRKDFSRVNICKTFEVCEFKRRNLHEGGPYRCNQGVFLFNILAPRRNSLMTRYLLPKYHKCEIKRGPKTDCDKRVSSKLFISFKKKTLVFKINLGQKDLSLTTLDFRFSSQFP